MAHSPKVVTNTCTNWARRSLTLAIWPTRLPLRQASHQTLCSILKCWYLHLSTGSDVYASVRWHGQCCGKESQCGREKNGQRLLTTHMHTRTYIAVLYRNIHTHAHTIVWLYVEYLALIKGLSSWWPSDWPSSNSQHQQQWWRLSGFYGQKLRCSCFLSNDWKNFTF